MGVNSNLVGGGWWGDWGLEIIFTKHECGRRDKRRE